MTEHSGSPSNHEEKKDTGCSNCSPFFACQNCSGFIIPETFLPKAQTAIQPEVVYGFYRDVFNPQYEPHLWQPPDIV
jgi:hypothetical protein